MINNKIIYIRLFRMGVWVDFKVWTKYYHKIYLGNIDPVIYDNFISIGPIRIRWFSNK